MFSILCFIILVSTTRFIDFLKALEWFKIPKIIIMLLSFLYRYIFIFTDQAMRMDRARKLRTFGKKPFHQFKVFGNMIGSLFGRSYERGERIYAAMVSRGFDGEIKTLNKFHLRNADVVICSVILVLFLSVKILSTLHYLNI